MSRTRKDQRKHRRKAWRTGRGAAEHAKRARRRGKVKHDPPTDRGK